MQQYIARLLIFAVLASNVVWAADNCLSTSASNADVIVQIDVGQDSGMCDDLCDGWLHLYTITPESGHDDFASVCQISARTDLVFDSREQDPPLRPPQI